VTTLFLLLYPDPNDEDGEEYLAAYAWASSAEEARVFTASKAKEERRGDDTVWSSPAKCTCIEASVQGRCFEAGEVTFGRLRQGYFGC